jgi:membrane protein DedA with SNARE-associated domain
MGVMIGEKGLDRYIPAKRIDKVRSRIKSSGAIALGALSLIPPPFPFTPFVLGAGALEVRAVTFFATIAGCRLVRFGLESWLARTYGRQNVGWLDSRLFQDAVIASVLLALVVTTLSIMRILRSPRPPRAAAA